MDHAVAKDAFSPCIAASMGIFIQARASERFPPLGAPGSWLPVSKAPSRLVWLPLSIRCGALTLHRQTQHLVFSDLLGKIIALPARIADRGPAWSCGLSQFRLGRKPCENCSCDSHNVPLVPTAYSNMLPADCNACDRSFVVGSEHRTTTGGHRPLPVGQARWHWLCVHYYPIFPSQCSRPAHFVSRASRNCAEE